MTENILPNSPVKTRILETIYNNPEINFTTLVKKTKTSPNIVLAYVNELVKNEIVKERRLGGEKKTHLRLFSPSFSTQSIDAFSFIEIIKKQRFLNKYKRLKPIFNQLSELLGNSNVKCCLVYGSFARFGADNESDLDLWCIGSENEKIKIFMSEIFSTLDRDYHVTIESENKFLKKINDPIHQNIIREHIIIYGEREFLRILAKK